MKGSIKKRYTLTFVLREEDRTSPVSEADFTGFYKGKIHILSCLEQPSFANQTVNISIKNLVSLNTCWVYQTRDALHDTYNGDFSVLTKTLVEGIHLKKNFSRDDLTCIARELGFNTSITKSAGSGEETDPKKAKKHDYILELDSFATKNITTLVTDVITSSILEPYLWEASDVLRLPFIQRLQRYLGSEMRLFIRKLSKETLLELDGVLTTTPWEMVFRGFFREKGLKIKPIKESKYYEVLECFKLKPPKDIYYALRIYFKVVTLIDKECHTCFEKAPLWVHEIPIMERPALDGPVTKYLTKRAITWIDAEKTKFALTKDFEDAQAVVTNLRACYEKAKYHKPLIRTIHEKVPCIPPTLTADQTKIAQHILDHPVTIVEGYPGTGKTVIITWAISVFSNTLAVSLTAMMTKSLHKRNGGHREVANTINYVTFHAEDYGGREWLAEVDVLIIDECSNVAMHLFTKLIKYLPNLKRIIICGDHEQIRPIKAGDPLGDMRDYFPFFKLHEILRVKPELVDLAKAPQLIVNETERHDGCKLIRFSEKGPISIVPKQYSPGNGLGENYEDTLRPILRAILKSSKSLMDHHVIMLQHKHRIEVNKACLKIFEQEGLFPQKKNTKKSMSVGYSNTPIFVGCKITFNKNYNKPLTIKVPNLKGGSDKLVSDPVANGELAIVKEIIRYHDCVYLTITDSDVPKECTIKHVICSTKIDGTRNFSFS